MEKATLKKPQPSLGLNDFLQKIKDRNYEFLTEVVVYAKAKKVGLFCEELHVFLPCEIGRNGFTEYSLSFEGDEKTPLCETRVRHIDLPTQDINNKDATVIARTVEPKTGLGPCFVCLYVTAPNTQKIRGIGFHGSLDDSNGILRPTHGCIRLFNVDLLLIRKLFYKNLKVSINGQD